MTKPVIDQHSFRQFPTQILNIGVSLTALFDMREETRHFTDATSYMDYNDKKANRPFKAGYIMPFMQKIMSINTIDNMLVNFTILSHNHPYIGLRVQKSLRHHGLVLKDTQLRQGFGEAYVTGRPITPAHLNAFGVDLFLSTKPEEVSAALKNGIAAGLVPMGPPPILTTPTNETTLAFDFDRVLGIGKGLPDDEFKGDSEAYYKQTSLIEFRKRERHLINHPGEPGPLAIFYLKLAQLRDNLVANNSDHKINLAVVTARTSDSFPRVLVTLDHWGGRNVQPDFAIATGNTPKINHLRASLVDMFFDDTAHNIQAATQEITSVFVPYTDEIEPRYPTASKRIRAPKAPTHE